MIQMEIMVAGRKIIFETHDLPLHLDEAIAYCLIEEFGNEEFLKKYAPNGTMRVGVGGGSLDEHPTLTSDRKEGECAATLVAKALGVDEDPGLKKILSFALSRDLKGGGSPFDLAAGARLISEKDSPEETIRWVKKFFKARYEQDLAFQTTAKTEYEKVAEEEIVGRRRLKMVIISTDNVLVRRFAFSLEGGQAAAVIQKFNSGHVQIFANRQRLGNGLDDVARMVRLAEQYVKGQLLTTDRNGLSAEGIVPGAEEWYYHRAGTALLNGRSPDNWGVGPTSLPLRPDLEKIVRIGIDFSYLPQHCRRSRCLGKSCGWYLWWLDRCQRKREG